ncbi:MAG: nitric oxide dioxygenase, partial [Williamsia sp.]|nr:nitric oxide dioxygenase [Williamsia sp.]
MTPEQKQLIKATIPTLKEHGQLLTTHFYQRVFAHHPELKNVFNQANQQSGRQPMALASAVLAYAEHIDNPAVLESALVRIGHKHTSLDIRPEHYPVVGQNLLASISEVLGEAATPELLDAWGAAYNQLARLMMDIETNLYATQLTKLGGWTGWRSFVVQAKIQESDFVTTLHLYPTDGALVAEHIPGQYVSLRVFLPELQLHQPNQYRIVSEPSCTHYAISVKRNAEGGHTRNDLFSQHLIEGIQTGYCVELSAPAGVVTPKDE